MATAHVSRACSLVARRRTSHVIRAHSPNYVDRKIEAKQMDFSVWNIQWSFASNIEHFIEFGVWLKCFIVTGLCEIRFICVVCVTWFV